MLLSIGIPTYSRPQLYKKLLESLLLDAGPFLGKEAELIVSNNASPDETDEVTRKILETKPVFQYYLQEKNIGGMQNFTFIINKSKGRFLWLIGNDDAIRPGTTERVLAYIKKYEDQNLGGIFLASIPSERMTQLDPIDWDEADRYVRGPRCEILETYDPDNAGRHIFHPDQNVDWMFISKCILLRSAYVETYNAATCQELLGRTLTAALYSIRGRTFIQDYIACVVAKIADSNTWDFLWHYVHTVDLLQCILELRHWGFTEPEIQRMVNSLFLTGRYCLELRHCFRPSMWSGGRSLYNWFVMMRLIVTNGYFRLMLSHLPGRNRRALRRLKNTIKEKGMSALFRQKN